jgi:hypothetical protein
MFKREYLKRTVITGEVVAVTFTKADYENVGVSYAPARGLPILEAFQLINGWNVSQDSQRTVYALPVE